MAVVGVALAALGLSACIDESAGPVALSGKPAVRVGLDLVARAIPGGTVTGRISGVEGDSLVLVINNLPALAGGQRYQVWLAEEETRAATRIGVRYTMQRPDTTGFDEFDGRPIIEWRDVAPLATVQAFDGTTGFRHILRLTRAELAAAGLDLSGFSHVVVTVGSSDASPFSAPAPAHFRYRGLSTAALTAGVVRFGFDPGTAATGLGWVPFGGGSVEWLNVEGFGLMAQRIARPPLGFFYEVWLVDEAGAGRLRLGEVLTPGPEFASLRDADVADGEFVTRGEMLRAARYHRWADLGATPDQFAALVIVLKSKDAVADELPMTVIYEAGVPPNLDQLPGFTDGFRERLGR
jgi:hypothetical protein